MARIKRPRRKFYTAGRGSRRFIWWWVQNQNKLGIDVGSPYYDTHAWHDNEEWTD